MVLKTPPSLKVMGERLAPAMILGDPIPETSLAPCSVRMREAESEDSAPPLFSSKLKELNKNQAAYCVAIFY